MESLVFVRVLFGALLLAGVYVQFFSHSQTIPGCMTQTHEFRTDLAHATSQAKRAT